VTERGSLAILVSGYLALILTLFLGGYSVALGLIFQNRVQGVADSALLYAHDRAVTKGVPNERKLTEALTTFLRTAPSAAQLEVASIEISVIGVQSNLVLCAWHVDPMQKIMVGRICKQSKAESFLVD
jgi:predicted benzoate:H+ symporter BenE